jgi:hypothetical protein
VDGCWIYQATDERENEFTTLSCTSASIALVVLLLLLLLLLPYTDISFARRTDSGDGSGRDLRYILYALPMTRSIAI